MQIMKFNLYLHFITLLQHFWEHERFSVELSEHWIDMCACGYCSSSQLACLSLAVLAGGGGISD